MECLYWRLFSGWCHVTNPLPPVFSSIYKDSNTLHLPTERFSPVRRFSDGAASIQAFKAHLEKMGNNSSIKQLQQVREGWGSSKQPPRGILIALVLLLQEAKVESLHESLRDTVGTLQLRVCSCSVWLQQTLSVLWMYELFTCSWGPGGIPAPSFLGRTIMLCPAMGVPPVPAGPPSIVRLQLLLSHISSGSSFGAVPECPGKGQLLPPEFGVYCGTFLAQPGTPCQWLEQDLAPGQAFPLAARHK